MATITTNAFDYVAPTPSQTKRKPNFAQRFLAALKASREAAARREIARHAHMIAGITNSASYKRDDLPF
jgi:hypothetical protein